MRRTDEYEGLVAEVITIPGHGGDEIHAYLDRPLGEGRHGGVVMMHHYHGWDEWNKEIARKFAHHGYVSISPNLYFRDGHGTPEDVGAKVRAAGGAPDVRVLGDLDGANTWLRALPYVSRKVGIFGTCSGGRQAFLAGCRLKGLDAVIECWGGRVVQSKEELTPAQPVAPIDYTKDLSCPIFGIFGNEDKSPTPEQVNQHEAELKKHGKHYEFHRYDGAGHGFFYYDRAAYRQEQAVDGWKKVFTFLEKTLH